MLTQVPSESFLKMGTTVDSLLEKGSPSTVPSRTSNNPPSLSKVEDGSWEYFALQHHGAYIFLRMSATEDRPVPMDRKMCTGVVVGKADAGG